MITGFSNELIRNRIDMSKELCVTKFTSVYDDENDDGAYDLDENTYYKYSSHEEQSEHLIDMLTKKMSATSRNVTLYKTFLDNGTFPMCSCQYITKVPSHFRGKWSKSDVLEHFYEGRCSQRNDTSYLTFLGGFENLTFQSLSNNKESVKLTNQEKLSPTRSIIIWCLLIMLFFIGQLMIKYEILTKL